MEHAEWIEAIPSPAVLVDASGRVAAMNAPGHKLFGAHGAGRHYMTLFRQPALLQGFEDAAQQPAKTLSVRVRGREGAAETTYDVTLRALSDSARVAVFTDVTAQAAAGEQRSEFVANVSHELRTPLTAILGFIETLRGPARDDADAREHFLAIMAREAERMNRLVDDLLLLSRVEDVERLRPLAPVDLWALTQRAVEMLRPLAAREGVEIALTGSAAQVPGDADQLLQVVNNLLENAIKYGGETVRVEIFPADDAPELAGRGYALRVSDDGEGIDAGHLGRLTERFYRVDTHRSRDVGGTGLGLAIVKHIVNRHRGRLRIDSQPGQGARFTVLLPI
ncbi:MAG: two-component sensor histidine kinase [Rhodobacterales bacterium]|nr:MAG: two-component sensor histidine kinase [Rhodobacterales bacterium]